MNTESKVIDQTQWAELRGRLNEYLNRGELAAFYQTIKQETGFKYPSLAMGIVTMDTIAGQVAVSYMKRQASDVGINMSDAQIDDVRKEMAAGYLNALSTKFNQGDFTDLTYQEALALHNLSFQAIGLPATAWTLYIPFTTLGSDSASEYWQSILNSTDSIGADNATAYLDTYLLLPLSTYFSGHRLGLAAEYESYGWWLSNTLGFLGSAGGKFLNLNESQAFSLQARKLEGYINLYKPADATTVDENNFEQVTLQFWSSFDSSTLHALNVVPTLDGGSTATLSAALIDDVKGAQLRAALRYLAPAYIEGLDLASPKISLINESTGSGDVNQSWLQDRVDLLKALLSVPRNVSAKTPFAFVDYETGQYTITSPEGYATNNGRIVFGSLDEANSLEGSQLSDRIYGGLEADTITAGSGDDVLYGFAGEDQLYGEEGKDILDGGRGDDVLEGGRGDDTLRGGFGDDKYVFSVGDGNDIVDDIDGSGLIQLAGFTGAGLIRVSETSYIWRTLDNSIIVSFSGSSLAESGELTISYGQSDTILIKEFYNGKLGIKLSEGTESPGVPVATGLTIHGDILTTSDSSYDSQGNVIGTLHSDPGKKDYLAGSDGIDQIYGWGGDDTIAAGAGNDYIEGGAGRNLINGGEDNDFIYASDKVDLGIINDFRPITDRDAVLGSAVSADNGDDIVVGSEIADLLLGGEGDDIIYGGDGNDVIAGDSESSFDPREQWDVKYDSDGIPTVTFPSWDSRYNDDVSGNDTLYGGNGNDTVIGGGGRDFIDGGEGNDVLYGGIGDDVVIGGNGDDLIRGGGKWERTAVTNNSADSNRLYGEDGNDIIIGDDGADLIDGGDGNDKLYGNDSSEFASEEDRDVIYGGKGNDIVSGLEGDDKLYGGDGDDYIFGGEGNDVLAGDQGADLLYGGNGNDFLDGGDGADILFGESGDDVYTVSFGDVVRDNSGISTVNLQVPFDTSSIRILSQTRGDDKYATILHDDKVVATVIGNLESYNFNFSNGDAFSFQDLVSRYSIIPSESNYIVVDGTTIGTQLSDTLQGDWNNQVFQGNRGNDLIYGHGGDDVVRYELGDGQDTVYQDSGSITIQLGKGISSENVAKQRLPDGSLSLGFSDGGSLVISNYFNQEFSSSVRFADGSVLADVDLREVAVGPIYGTAEADHILGSISMDVIYGRDGDDLIDGRGGDDTVYGEGGTDTYVFGSRSGNLTIHESAGSTSIIKLDGVPGASVLAKRDGDDLIISSSMGNGVARIVDYYVSPMEILIQDGSERTEVTLLSDANLTYQSELTALERIHAVFSAATSAEVNGYLESLGDLTKVGGVFVNQVHSSQESHTFRRLPGYTGTVPSDWSSSNISTLYVYSLVNSLSETQVDGQFNSYDLSLSSPSGQVPLGAVHINGEVSFAVPSTSVGSKVWNHSVDESIYRFVPKDPGIAAQNIEVGLPQAEYEQLWIPIYRYVDSYTEEWQSSIQTGVFTNLQITASNVWENSSVSGSEVSGTGYASEVGTRDVVLRGGANSDTFNLYSWNFNLNFGTLNSNSRLKDSISVYAGDGDDNILFESYGNDSRGVGAFLAGENGNDTIKGTDFADWIVGGAGNDILDGGSGADTYVFSKQDIGYTDTIDDRGSAAITEFGYDRFAQDIVLFDNGISREEVSFAIASKDGVSGKFLKVSWAADSNIFIPITTDADSIAKGIGIEEFRFSDGSMVSFAEALKLAKSQIPSSLGTIIQSDGQHVEFLSSATTFCNLSLETLKASFGKDTDVGSLKLNIMADGELTPVQSFSIVDDRLVVGGFAMEGYGVSLGGAVAKAWNDVSLVITAQGSNGEVKSLQIPTSIAAYNLVSGGEDGSVAVGLNDARNYIYTPSNGAAVGGDLDDSFSMLAGGNANADGRDGGDTYTVALAEGYATTINDSGITGSDSIFVYDVDYMMGQGSSMFMDIEGDNLVISSMTSQSKIVVEHWSDQRDITISAYNSSLGHDQINNLVHALAAFGPAGGSDGHFTDVQKGEISQLVIASFQESKYTGGLV